MVEPSMGRLLQV